MTKKRLPKLDLPTKTFKVDGVPGELVQLFVDYIEISAEDENKTHAQVLEEILMPAVKDGLGEEAVHRNLRVYRCEQEQIRKIHAKAEANSPGQNL